MAGLLMLGPDETEALGLALFLVGGVLRIGSVLVVCALVFDLAAKLTYATSNTLAYVTDPRGSEEDYDDGENDEEFRSAKTLKNQHEITSL